VADENGKTGNLSAGSQPGPADARTEAAARVLENLAELEPELVSAGIFEGSRAMSISSGSATWEKEAVGLLEALEAASGDEKFDSAHVAGVEGEVFAVSESGLSLVTVTGRFVLASLTAYDMRMALRDVARAGTTDGSGKPRSRAENAEDEDA
jgi:hypothetical protein